MKYSIDFGETKIPATLRMHTSNCHVVIVASQCALSCGLMHKCQIKRLIYDMLKACTRARKHTHTNCLYGGWILAYLFGLYHIVFIAIAYAIWPIHHSIRPREINYHNTTSVDGDRKKYHRVPVKWARIGHLWHFSVLCNLILCSEITSFDQLLNDFCA